MTNRAPSPAPSAYEDNGPQLLPLAGARETDRALHASRPRRPPRSNGPPKARPRAARPSPTRASASSNTTAGASRAFAPTSTPRRWAARSSAARRARRKIFAPYSLCLVPCLGWPRAIEAQLNGAYHKERSTKHKVQRFTSSKAARPLRVRACRRRAVCAGGVRRARAEGRRAGRRGGSWRAGSRDR